MAVPRAGGGSDGAGGAAGASGDRHVAAGCGAGGAGLVALPLWAVAAEIAQGRLVRVLGGWETPESGVYAVYPSNRMVTPRVRTCVDHLVRHLRTRLPEGSADA